MSEPAARPGSWAVAEVAAAPLEHAWSEFFAGLRATRAERYAAWKPGMGGDKRRAVLTMVHDEQVFFPIWLGYYSRFFAPGDIYVLDHQTTDGSTDGAGFVRIPVEHESVDHTWMVRTIEAQQRALFEHYDAVLTTDVDEIVAPDPAWGTLGDYIDRLDEEFVNCLGYEILHMADREPAIHLDRPILEQRGYWFANRGFDKPALATRPTTWEPGFHTLVDGGMNLDPDLRMIHLHRMDYEACLNRHSLRTQRRWNRRDLKAGWAKHNLVVDGPEFERWFYEGSCFDPGDRLEIRVEPVPPAWRALF